MTVEPGVPTADHLLLNVGSQCYGSDVAPGTRPRVERRPLRSHRVLAAALGILLALVPTLALANLWTVIPGCSGDPFQNPFFYPDGPINGWSVHKTPDGQGNCHWRANTKSSPTPVNTASWYLPISTNYNHAYSLFEFVPCQHASSHAWVFRRYANGTGGGYVTVTRSSYGYCDLLLVVDAATYNGSNGGYIKIVDNTGTCSGCNISACWLYYSNT